MAIIVKLDGVEVPFREVTVSHERPGGLCRGPEVVVVLQSGEVVSNRTRDVEYIFTQPKPQSTAPLEPEPWQQKRG